MFSEERRIRIMDIINSGKTVTVEELSKMLDVSESTIRRDLKYLEGKGLIHRTHGGAMNPLPTNYEPTFLEKKEEMIDEKKAIGRKAASLIEDGDTVIIDSGTTTMEIVRNLSVNRAKIVTNSPHAAIELQYRQGIEVILTGGMLRYETQALVGPIADELIQRIKADKAFIGTNGITLDGFTTPNVVEAATKRNMVRNAEKVYIVADSTKFNKASFMRFADLDEVDCIITDSKLPEDVYNEFSGNGIDIIKV
ncbi:DeoR/GlpR family DNA-binding transcription regulator [Calorimonas adulescens]|jgi:Bacterial regulatory proteins, deoR family./DeoR-like helix-turn-helix domain.|uniref:DeoR/GlpR family DNA-binding transcription regulator n=1 Tax=Calorimonas adulescens TaxID=2606906 RepID=UPI001EF0BF66|nr:DeoR/GlpR family DNA-binding transcription regulator [Calorimonas adulescens]MDI6600774.1 DeoR/GlpR family DNA-binding transcription regulator [Thermoanaerobacteraceae bacterium]